MSKTEPDSLKHGRGPRDDRGVVEARIVAAARTAFAEHGLAGTSMRKIARDADVDPSLVHYYFDSKEALLDAATTPPAEFFAGIQAAVTATIDERAEAILRNVLHQWEQPETAAALRSIILTAAHEPSTLEKLRQTLSLSLMAAVAAELPGEARMLRASLVGTQVIGLVMIRYVWKIDPVASLGDDEVLALVGPGVQRYLSGELATG